MFKCLILVYLAVNTVHWWNSFVGLNLLVKKYGLKSVHFVEGETRASWWLRNKKKDGASRWESGMNG